MSKKIGLVLNEPLSYSLTFIVNEIVLWQQLGYEVILFTKQKRKVEVFKLSVSNHVGLPLKLQGLGSIFKIFWGLLKVLLFGSAASFRFMKLELANGTPLKLAFKKFYKVAHVLPHHLDFVHFGFGHAMVDKEYLAPAMKAPMSVSFRGTDISVLPLLKPGIYNKAAARVDKIHVISNDLLTEVLNSGFDKKSSSIVQIYQTLNFVDFENIVRNERTSPTLNIITVARLHWKKGIEYALAAMKQLEAEGIECTYTIVGSGEHEGAVRYAIKELKLEKRVFLAGALSYCETLKLMAKSDMYIQTSVQEGFCNAALEAQALGLLTVVTNAEGLHENVINGVTGWVVPKRNSDALVKQIKEVMHLTDEEKLKITSQAIERVKTEFYLSRYQEKWRAFFS
jgi:glycosyltransferase involved in cell wall biosynthesis